VILDEIDPTARALLERSGFDAVRFEALRGLVAAGTLGPSSNIVAGLVEPPEPGDLTDLPAPGEAAFADTFDAGVEALRAGRVASLVLAGGMATRFGGVVKGVVEALDGRSFLEIKLSETARIAAALGARIPVALMTSFSTDEIVRAHVAQRGLGEPLVFSQFAAPRLRPDGSLFRDAAGHVSLYGPGHGDLLEAIRASGTLATLQEDGVRHVVVSNVDNLGGRVDPAVIGAHVLAGRPLTLEVASKGRDLGGAPARVDGRLTMLEAPRFPASFDQTRIPVFNTNTGIIDVEVLERPVELTWLVVERDVDGERAIQLERVYHELASFVPTTFLVVPRRGPRGRFFPIKVPADLDRERDALREMLAASPL
jgi:UTP--glucose-1-phosphate uridylyltransferase